MFAEDTEKLVNELIQAEYKNACEKFGEKYNSLCEGYVVLFEEIEEVNNEMTSLNQMRKDLVKLVQNPKAYKKDILEFSYFVIQNCTNAIKELAQVGAVLKKIQNTLEVEE